MGAIEKIIGRIKVIKRKIVKKKSEMRPRGTLLKKTIKKAKKKER